MKLRFERFVMRESSMTGHRKTESSPDTYTEEEAQRRFEAALRGARLAEAKPMKDAATKTPESKGRPRKAPKPSP